MEISEALLLLTFLIGGIFGIFVGVVVSFAIISDLYNHIYEDKEER